MHTDKPIMGIYSITNILNDRIYIGSSVNIRNRWTAHRSDLRRKKHHTARLQMDWNIFGEPFFVFAIIEEVSDRAQLIDREQHHLDQLQTANRYNTFAYADNRGAAQIVEGYFEEVNDQMTTWEQFLDETPKTKAMTLDESLERLIYDDPNLPWCVREGLNHRY